MTGTSKVNKLFIEREGGEGEGGGRLMKYILLILRGSVDIVQSGNKQTVKVSYLGQG